MNARFTVLSLCVMAALLLAACQARRREPIRGPLRLVTAQEQRGEVEYMRYCHRCHPGGEAGLAPAIADKPLPDFLTRFQIRHGLGSMPTFSREVLDDKQVDAILAYIRALRRNPPLPREQVELANGAGRP